jgi:two-component system sensor histidine kinase BaeS
VTRRLIAAMVAVVLATLVIVGAGTLVLSNVRARATTERELRTQSADLAAGLADVITPDAGQSTAVQLRVRRQLINVFRRVLQLEGVAIIGGRLGEPLTGDPLPAGLEFSDADIEAFERLEIRSGNDGNLVYAAAPAKIGANNLFVVVLSREANAGLGASLRLFLLAAGATLALGIGAALLLGLRITRPIREAAAATHQIAAGQLATRLPEPAESADDEMADLARSINNMARALERSRAVEQQFLMSVSHDLRTPLTSIRGYAEAIADGAGDPKRAAAVIHSESRRLERLVADLLDLAKMQSQSFSLQVATVDLAAAASVALAGFEPDAAERGVRLHRAAPEMLPVYADPDRLAQVLANLIENALRHAASAVTMTTWIDGDGAILTIDDDGPGISAEDLPHVFERLYVSRVRPERRENSSGLGLAVVKELVTAMGGHVWATTAPGGGARIAVRLRRSG